MADDETLRSNRLTFYKDTIDQTEKFIKEFLKLSNAKNVFFIDRDGHTITQVGAPTKLDPDALAALIAGSFAATKELAHVLGEAEFSTMYHKGEKDHVHITLVGSRAMLAVLFDDQTTEGMVNLYCKELAEKLTKVLDIAERQQKSRGDEGLGDDFNDSVKDKLDELFED